MDIIWNNIEKILALITVIGSIGIFFIWFWKNIKKPDFNTEKRFSAEDVNLLTEQARNDERKRVEKNLVNFSIDLEKRGNHAGAKKLAEAQEALANNELSKADKLFAEIEEGEELTLLKFADVSFARGYIAEEEIRWKDAAQHYTRAAEIDPCFKTLLRAQALAISVGTYPSALSLGLAAQKAAREEYGEESEQHTISLNNLGENYKLLTQYKKAESYHIEALRIKEKIFGKNHPDTATSLDNLSTLYIIEERYKEAMLLCERALKIRTDSFGDNHPDTANSINSLGGIYQEQEQYIKAKNLFNKALAIRKKVLAKKHPDIAQSMNNLAGSYYKQKQYKKARPLYLQALKILDATLGHDHPYTKGVKANCENNNKRLAHAEKTTPQ